MKNSTLLMLIIFFNSFFHSFSQNQDNPELIMNRIKIGEGHPNLKYIEGGKTQLGTENSFFRENISDPDSTGHKYVYKIYFWKFWQGDSVIPLAIQEHHVQTIPSKTSEDTGKTVIDITTFRINTGSLIKMYKSDEGKGFIQELIRIIKANKATSTYTDNMSDKNKLVSRDQYYIDFAEITNNHWYRQRAPTENNQGLFSQQGSNQQTYQHYIELSFSSLSISHSYVQKLTGINLGFEFGLHKDNILNLLEYQNPVFTVFGVSTFFNIGDNLYADIKILPQIKFDSKQSSEMNLWPIFAFDPVKINKSQGVAIEGHFLGSLGNFKLPFINIYLYNSRKDYNNPVFTRSISPDTVQSYYSLTQWEISSSFYWNIDKNNYNKFKLDIGTGGYDIWNILYDIDNNVISNTKIKKTLSLSPFFTLEYVHSSDKRFGSIIRLFDNRVRLGVWLTLLKLGNHELRVEENYISKLFGREMKEWEHEGSSNMMQLIYRYGLN
jgi:hypothetical protein